VSPERPSLASRIIQLFLEGNLTPLVILLALIAGAVALQVTPREEEPQIVVPLADVLVQVPGASAAEVERVVSSRLEKLLYQVDGVEYVYSISRPNLAVITVRFFVGENREDSLLKIYNKIHMNADRLPPQVTGWVIHPIEIDDVPVLSATLWSDSLDDYALRRVAEELEIRLQSVPGTGRTEIYGGRSRRIRILIDPDRLDSHNVSLDDLSRSLRGAAVALPAGRLTRGGSVVELEAGRAPLDLHELESLVVAVHEGRPVYLRDVAEAKDGPDEPSSYVRFGFGVATDPDLAGRDHPAVTIAVAKKKGENAVLVTEAVRERLEELRAEILPDGVEIAITRDYGLTADHKVDELVEGLIVAIIIVILLLAMALGWRESLIVAAAVPIAFSLTLIFNYLAGYTINRVTLFSLILALGLVVDDPIVDVENIFRHLRMGKRKPMQAVLDAVNEVRPPIIMATLAVILSFLPLYFISGMMGPYMAPMAFCVPLAMLMSLVVAFTVTPWLSYQVFKNHRFGDEEAPPLESTRIYRFYAATLGPLLESRTLRWIALGATGLLFLGAGWLAMDRHVPLKMLPFDNKDELQVVVDLPEGRALEPTEAAVAEMAAAVRGFPEVTSVTSYAGQAAPIDFNGLVRHYYMRQAPNLGELRINLRGKKEREHQSHQIAVRIRQALRPIAERHDADIKLVEPPPGPPVIATVAVEVYGPASYDTQALNAAALDVAARLEREAGVFDVDTTAETPHSSMRYVLDREKAALHGVDTSGVARGLQAAVAGATVAVLHADTEVRPLEVQIRLPRGQRTDRADLERLTISGPDGAPISLAELGRFVMEPREQPIYHKNLRRVAYVFAEVAGRAPADVILDVQADRGLAGSAREIPVEERSFLANGAGLPWDVDEKVDLVWDGEGEWQVTIDAFLDLGIAFAIACLGIYILLVHETKSYLTPVILMVSIPLTMIGIIPGFWLLNLAQNQQVAGLDNPVFFTATAMIGMIALAGIAVRNAILLIEFVHVAEKEGLGLKDALLQSGAVRFRPIFLTGGTAMLAAVPITMDPIFSGLAWALIFGLLVSTAFTLVLVPMIYYMVYARRSAAGTAAESE